MPNGLWPWRFDTYIHTQPHTHTCTPTPTYAHTGKNPNWIRFVHTISQRWQTYFEHWALSGFPVLVVHYEDLKVNTVVTVMRILEFLKFPYSEEEVRDRLSEDFSLFRRTTHPTFEHFSIAQKNYIRSKIKETLALLKESNHGDTLGVEAYINTTMLRHYWNSAFVIFELTDRFWYYYNTGNTCSNAHSSERVCGIIWSNNPWLHVTPYNQSCTAYIRNNASISIQQYNQWQFSFLGHSCLHPTYSIGKVK